MTMPGPMRRAAARVMATWVGVPNVPAARRWALVVLVDAIGTGMFLPVSVLYLTVVIRLPVTSVGVGLGIAGLAAAVISPVAGPLTDRFGSKRAVLACLMLAACGYLGYLAVRTWSAFVIVASVAMVADYMARPAKKVFVTAIVSGTDRVPLMAFQRSVRNMGYGVGGLVTAGLLVAGGRLGYQIVLLTDALSYAAAAGMVLTIPVLRGPGAATSEPRPRPAPASVRPTVAGAAATLPARARAAWRRARSPQRLGYLLVLRDRRYVALAVLDVLVLVYATAFTIGMPLWIHERTHAPASLVGVLFTLNTVLVTVLQVRLTKGYTRVRQARRLYLRTAWVFGLAALAYWGASRMGMGGFPVVAVLVVAVLAHTVAELYASVAEWTVSVNLAPERLRGRYLSVYSLSLPVNSALAPGLVTLLIAGFPDLAWFFLAGVLAIGCLASAWLLHGAAEPDELASAATSLPGTAEVPATAEAPAATSPPVTPVPVRPHERMS